MTSPAADIIAAFEGRTPSAVPAWELEFHLRGNVDCGLLITGKPQAVYDSAVALLKSCKPRRFAFGASNAVQREVPIENYRAMHAAWLDHRLLGR